METEFRIIYDRIIEIGSDLKTIPIDKDFFVKVKIYQNFFAQMMQILNNDKIEAMNFGEELKMVEQLNVDIEDRLRKAKSEVKSDIHKTNLKEKIKKQYN